MKVLQLTKNLMKVCGALPIFPSTFEGKCLETLKMATILICPIFVGCSTFLFFTLHTDNFSLMTTAMYICMGYILGTSLLISFFYQSGRIIHLLKQLETLVNSRIKSNDFGENYYKTDDEIYNFTRKVGLYWCGIMYILTSGPFTDAFIDHFIRKDEKISWQLLYDASVNFGNVAKAKNAVPILVIQCTGALILVYGFQIPQFLFVAISHYFSTLMEDVKSVIKRFDRDFGKLDDLIEMITVHRDSLEFANLYREIMNAPIFIANTMNMVCIGIVLFQIQDTLSRGDYVELPRTLIANFVVLQLMCTFCYLGQQLSTTAAEIHRAICDTEWYNYRPKIQILLIPIIMRTQKPFVMTGFSLVSASLASFKEMMSFIASAFLLLQKMKD